MHSFEGLIYLPIELAYIRLSLRAPDRVETSSERGGGRRSNFGTDGSVLKQGTPRSLVGILSDYHVDDLFLGPIEI